MTEDKLLIATHSGTIKIIDQELSCAVLKNGTRILSVTAVFCAFLENKEEATISHI